MKEPAFELTHFGFPGGATIGWLPFARDQMPRQRLYRSRARDSPVRGTDAYTNPKIEGGGTAGSESTPHRARQGRHVV
jgi:hypothetical protein